MNRLSLFAFPWLVLMAVCPLGEARTFDDARAIRALIAGNYSLANGIVGYYATEGFAKVKSIEQTQANYLTREVQNREVEETLYFTDDEGNPDPRTRTVTRAFNVDIPNCRVTYLVQLENGKNIGPITYHIRARCGN